MTNNDPEHAGKVTEDYPGLVVDDGRVSGSITMGHSRLPLWCVIQTIVKAGYGAAIRSHPDIVNRATSDEIGWFLYDLLENRKKLARLLCVLADVERREREARWNQFGRNAVYLHNATPEVRDEIALKITALGLGPLVEVDGRNSHSARRWWYAETENVARVRKALLSCLEHLQKLEASSWNEAESS
jgi:hypothetical protein